MQSTPRNIYYRRDIMFMTSVTRNILSAFGVWPNFSTERSIRKILYKCLAIILSYLFIFCAIVPGVLFWLVEKRTRVRIKTTSLLLYGLISCVKYGNLIIRQDQIRRCFKYVEEDWKNVMSTDVRNIMLESSKFGRRLMIIGATFLYSSGFSFRVLIPLAKRKITNEYNITIKPLPYPSYLFSLNTQATPIYEILYTIQSLSGLVTLSISSGACGLIFILIMHACGQLKVLMNLMKSFIKEQWQQELELDKKLADIVEHQIRIHRFLRLVENTLQQICFVEMTGATIIVCLFGYYIMTEWEDHNIFATCSNLISLSAAIVNIFIHCYAGEQLITQAEKVAIASYELEWYRLSKKKMREIALVMVMSNVPMKITAGKLIVLSIKSFGDMIKTSGAYFNVLRSLT